MGGSQKSKRVSWASEVNLCQVRLFLSEECPSEVGIGTQDNHQAKAWQLQGGGMGSNDNLPPGFELVQFAHPWAAKLSQISLVKWKCPPRMEVDCSWLVVAGDESREIETQNEREMRVLEAIYPRPSAIPLNPSAFLSTEDSSNNDRCPVVPITPIEDEDASMDASYASTGSNICPTITQQQHSPHGTFPSQLNATVKPTVDFSVKVTESGNIAAAQAALSSVIPNSDQGNPIDRELLMKILRDPKMLEQLIGNHTASSTAQNVMSPTVQTMTSSSALHGMPEGIAAGGAKNITFSTSPGMPSTSAQYIPSMVPPPKSSFDSVNTNTTVHRRDPLSARVPRPEMAAPSSIPTASGPFHPPTRTGPVISASSPSVTKDINYYKSLIQQHGGERRETMPQFCHQSNQPQGIGQEPMNNNNNNMMKPRDSKPKIMRPCIYFNSARGCRNGANCMFQHNLASQQETNRIPEVQGTKRMKLDREINGA